MDRRESLKSMVFGSIAVGLTFESCITSTPKEVVEDKLWQYSYGRTPKEADLDEELLAKDYFTATERETLSALANRILPPNEHGTIEEANVIPFIEFMAKDVPEFQITLRGGLMWLDGYCNGQFNTVFVGCTQEQQHAVLDIIAFPDPDARVQKQPVQFFSLVRNLVLTGYFTSEVGIKELGYKGNQPNEWDGVPEDVLEVHGMQYDPEWLAKCVDPATRGNIAEWDADGNLIS